MSVLRRKSTLAFEMDQPEFSHQTFSSPEEAIER
jgi:hypothetical protein